MNNMTAALIITGVGMGLVFVVIVLLWGFMALLVKLTVEKVAPAEAAAEDDSYVEPAAAVLADDSRALKLRAAAVAVAAALALQKNTARLLPPAVSVSHWQANGRASALSARASLFNRKSTR